MTSYCTYTVILCLFVIILFPACASGQVQTDSSHIDVRSPDTERIDAYANSSEFQYGEVADGESLITLLIRELIQFFDDTVGEGTGETILKTVFLLLLMGVLLLILNQVMNGNIRSAMTGKSAAGSVQFSSEIDGQAGINFSRLIDSAVKSGDYRKAVRLQYQKTLSDLNRAGLIEWTANKTNHDYLSEIRSHPTHGDFLHMTRIYEFTEYGEFAIDQAGFNRVRSLYDRLSRQLSGGSNG